MEPTKAGDGTVRHDLEPLTSRIPALAAAESATWCSGTLGDDRVPGPTTYWIDAVVVLPAEVADELRAELALQESSVVPDVVPQLTGVLPAGPFLAGDPLDQRFSAGTWASSAQLEASGAVLVLEIRGGH